MPTLEDILGAVLKDLLKARAAADAVSADLRGEYQQNAVLSQLSVPRLTIGQATLTVRYVVNDYVFDKDAIVTKSGIIAQVVKVAPEGTATTKEGTDPLRVATVGGTATSGEPPLETFDVSVRLADLQQAVSGALQEISLTVSMDDIESASTPS